MTLSEVADESNSGAIVFNGEIQRTDPFPHFVSSRFYAQPFSDKLLAWLETSLDWKLAVTAFYSQYELGFNRHSCSKIRDLWQGKALGRLRDGVMRSFGVAVSRRITISAHKLVAGQYIAIHTDKTRAETHRVVVQLNRGRPDESGGHLVFLSGLSQNDVKVAFSQTSNSAIGFALGASSYHAVTPVNTGTRFTIIYTFLSDVARDDEYEYFEAQ